MKSWALARKQDSRAAIFKKYITINIKKNSAQTRNLLAKTYEQQTTEHLPNSKNYLTNSL